MRSGSSLALAAGLLVACGGSSSGTGQNAQYLITISSYTYSPANLSVPPGATVTVQNQDAMNHSVTSEATVGAYVPGAVSGVSFDTGPFSGQATFTIPASAVVGTVVPYFCTVHKAAMANQGQLTVVAPPASDGGLYMSPMY